MISRFGMISIIERASKASISAKPVTCIRMRYLDAQHNEVTEVHREGDPDHQ